tara:strand:- start:39 stop:875 length:837 start_codon:yes stop_codon:yes gene_type:complete
MKTLPVLDSVIKNLILDVDDESYDWNKEKQKLKDLIECGAPIDRNWVINQIEKYCNRDKSKVILDYGCGTGILNLLLLLKGYENVHGVDIVEKFNDNILRKLNFNKASFKLIKDNEKLPYEDESFDIITSSLVLEHVENIDHYYSEAARLLKPGGVCFFHFPHRLKPYDSHSRCWFVHYFPKTIRILLWNIFARQDGKYLNEYLYLRTIYSHKKCASSYFKVIENRSLHRMKGPVPVNYGGNIRLRNLVSRSANLKLIGNFIARVLSLFLSADLFLKK